jgi:hypothetical protein
MECKLKKYIKTQFTEQIYVDVPLWTGTIATYSGNTWLELQLACHPSFLMFFIIFLSLSR